MSDVVYEHRVRVYKRMLEDGDITLEEMKKWYDTWTPEAILQRVPPADHQMMHDNRAIVEEFLAGLSGS